MSKDTDSTHKDIDSTHLIIAALTKALSINYYNVSLKETDNSQDIPKESVSKIFEDRELVSEKFDFCRNILIIGAGAAKSELDVLPTGETAITKIEQSLKLGQILSFANGKLENRYKILASHYKKMLFSNLTNIGEIKKLLGFEGRLSLLLNFYEKQDVLDEIKRILDFQFLYCRFYFIIVQYFKNRLIDVIVNFNFDELLDNAIDDEMSNYHKIVHDSDCKPISELIDNNRIRIPIYVKPHGTISSKTSLLFTKEQYIDMSEDMKKLLDDLFVGKVASDDDAQRVKNINIIVVGFALESIEFNNILFSIHKYGLMESIRIYLFLPNAKEVAQSLEANYKQWQVNNNIPASKGKYVSILPLEIPVSKGGKLDIEHKILTKHFIDIYCQIRNKFKDPFKPVALKDGDIFSKLFPSKELNKIGTEIINPHSTGIRYKEYLKKRFTFHLLCELVRWKGKLAINVVINERPGRYYQQYKKYLKKRKLLAELCSCSDLIGILNELEIKMYQPDKFSDNIYKCEDLFLHEDSKLDSIKVIAKKIIINSYAKISPSLINKVSNFLDEEMYNKRTYQINSQYEDFRHLRFHYFPDEQIIPTNLNLTYKFFEYSVLKGKKNENVDWDTMLLAGESGKPLYNLHQFYNSPETSRTHLQEFIKEKGALSKKVYLLYSEDKEINVNKANLKKIENKEEGVKIKINTVLTQILSKDNFKKSKIPISKNIHHMALFLKNGIPIYGIYFFKPEARSKINPVWFDSTIEKPYNNSKNLKNLTELFQHKWNEFNKGKKLLNLIKA